MTSFDPVAAAVDWLDAHRAAALDSLLPLYDDGASLECSCGGQKVIVGKGAIARYWRQRFVDAPALDLEDIQLAGNSVTVSYRIPGGNCRSNSRLQWSRQDRAKPLRPGRRSYLTAARVIRTGLPPHRRAGGNVDRWGEPGERFLIAETSRPRTPFGEPAHPGRGTI